MTPWLVTVALLGQMQNPYYQFNPGDSCIGASGGVLAGNVCEAQSISDTLPATRAISAQPAYERAIGANRVGGSKIVCGGIGTKQETTFLTGTGADIYTATYQLNNGTSGTFALTAGVSFVCGPTQAECAFNFMTAANVAATGLGITYTCDDATCSTLAVYEQFNQCVICSFVHAITDVGGAGVFAVAVSGANGSLQTPSLASTSSGFCFANDTDTCISRHAANTIGFQVGGGIIGTVSAAALTMGNSSFITNGGVISTLNRIPIGTTCALGGAGDVCAGQALYVAGETYAQIEADLVAGACTAKRMVVDTGGASRENCRCNSAGAAYDCCTIAAAPTCSTNGPVD